MTMPVLDGLEATRLLKATKATRDTRVIAYTGNPPLADSPVHQLFAAVLPKPSTPDVLLAAVQSAFAPSISLIAWRWRRLYGDSGRCS